MSKSLDDILSSASDHRTARVHNAKVAEESHIFNFIKDNDIKVGTCAVPMQYIYALYCEQFRPPIKGKRFSMYFKLFFEKKFSADRCFYRLDPTPFKMPENWTLWKEIGQNKWKYKKTKFNNIRSTPDGWMIYIDVQGGRKIIGFEHHESKAALYADKVLWFYYGPNYTKFNFKSSIKGLSEADPDLQRLLTLKKVKNDSPQEKESL